MRWRGFRPGLGARLKKVAEQRAGDYAEHLLANHVGGLADAMDEGVHLLDGRRLDHVEAVGAKQLARHVLHVLPGAHVAAVEVLGSLNLLSHPGLLLVAWVVWSTPQYSAARSPCGTVQPS